MCGHFKVFLSKRFMFLSLYLVLVSGIVCVAVAKPSHAQSSSAFNGGVKLDYDSRSCTSAIEGSIRYSSSAGSGGGGTQISLGEWSQVGNTYDNTDSSFFEVDALDSNTVAIIDRYDGTNLTIGTFDFDGTDWTQDGNSYNIMAAPDWYSMAPLDSDTIAFVHGPSGGGDAVIETYDFDELWLLHWLELNQ